MDEQIELIARRAKEASCALADTSEEERNGALERMAQALRSNASAILSANEKDVKAAASSGVKESLIDRLALDEQRILDMARALEELVLLPDPLNQVREERRLYNGLDLKRVSVPLGVVAVIYEARPNVTADAAGICLKSGNACILRGGSMAAASNEAITHILSDAAHQAGCPADAIQMVASTDHAATDAMMQLHGLVDVIIPRGGAGLIRHCVEVSKVPVIETGTGNCHVYIHESADASSATSIAVNAKCRRFGVCNAAETLLVDESAAQRFLPEILSRLVDHGVNVHADETAYGIALATGLFEGPHAESALFRADEADWETEYLSADIAVKCVKGVADAISHINRYGTGHSEAIVAQDEDAIEAFLHGVDAAAVYANASTAFTDGGQFGLGAEIGISTQKLHVRGPFALNALTSCKYVIRGEGQVRD